MKYIFGIVGKARHGKDTLATLIEEYFKDTIRVSEATPLKDEVKDILGIDTIEELDHYKNNNITYNGTNVRKLLQSTADKNKEQYGRYYYLDQLIETIDNVTNPIVIISDVRFKINNTILRDKYVPYYITFKIVRDKIQIVESNHNSETEIDSIETDYLIKNNSTLEDLRYIVFTILDRLCVYDSRLLEYKKDI